MYPHVVQLDARRQESARELQLIRERRHAERARSRRARSVSRLLRSAVQPLIGPS